MVGFLESYLGLAILAAVTVLCIGMKAMVAARYRKIARQTEKMDTTKDKTVRSWRRQFEDLSGIRNGVANVAVFSEKCMHRYRRFGVTLRRWDALAKSGITLTLLLGLLLAFGSYWYRLDYRLMILYGSAAVVLAGAAILMSMLIDVNGKEEQALVALQDYLENRLLPSLYPVGYSVERRVMPQKPSRTTLEPEEESVLKEVFQEYLT